MKFQTRQLLLKTHCLQTIPWRIKYWIVLLPWHPGMTPFLDFCFGLGHGRRKRHDTHRLTMWNGCNRSDSNKFNYCLNKHNADFSKITLTCLYNKYTSYYWAVCKMPRTLAPEYKCQLVVHVSNWQPLCCTASCWIFVVSRSFTV